MTPAKQKKYLLAAGALVAAYWLFSNRKSLVKDLDVSITQFGKPSVKAGVISAPVGIAITNDNLVPIPVTNLTADIYLKKEATWLKIGSTVPTGNFTIPTGTSNFVLQPQIAFKNFGRNLFDALNNLLTAKPTIKIVSIANVQGFEFTQEKIFTL